MTEIKLEFIGYRRDEKKSTLEEDAGIYCVYRCVFDPSDSTVELKELLYIGQADNLHNRLADHEKFDLWKRRLNKGEQICYSRAHIKDKTLRLRAEAALICHHNPPENTQHNASFGYPATRMIILGKCEFLDTDFTIEE